MDVTITNGQPASLNVPLSPVSAATLAGTVTLPPSFSILGYNLFLYDASDPFAPTRVHFTSESGNALPTSFSFAVPSGPNLGVAMYVIADGNGGTASAFVTNPGTSPVSIVRPGVPANSRTIRRRRLLDRASESPRNLRRLGYVSPAITAEGGHEPQARGGEEGPCRPLGRQRRLVT